MLQVKLLRTDSCINILTDTGCGISACTRKFVEDNQLKINKSATMYKIEQMTAEKIYLNKFAHFKVKFRRKGAHVFNINALILPGGHWKTPLPKNRPTWLPDLNVMLAHPKMTDQETQYLDYQVILGGDYMNQLKFQPFYFDKTFGLVDTLGAGYLEGNLLLPTLTTCLALHRSR
jgi:hypothetical protein